MTEMKKCEYCSKDINVNSKICPFCGGEVRDTSDLGLSPLCPRCSISLKVHNMDGEDYNLCPKCGGMWLDRGTFHQVTKESEVYRKEDTQKKYFRGSLKDSIKYIPCVRCGKLMNRKNFARISGVIIDECHFHGVWLDPGELEKIRLFIVDGGLERAQDKQIEKVSENLRELARKVDRAAFIQRLLHFWNFKRWLFGGEKGNAC